MSTITRSLPETTEDRYEALGLARNKRNTLPPGANPFTPATNTRLEAIWTDLNTRRTAIATAKSLYNTGTPLKLASANALRLFVSHTIQVFNFGVSRGKYPAGHRVHYQLPAEESPLPELTKDTDLLLWAKNLVDGDTARLAAGGVAMANPDMIELDIASANYLSLFNSQSTNKDNLDMQQEGLEAILNETDKVIKKVWDELDTFYNEETDESRRENLREWGVVYVTQGNPKTLSGTVTYNGTPGAGLSVHFKSGKNKSIADGSGAYSLSTSLMGEQKVMIDKLDDEAEVIKSWEFSITLNESGDKTENFIVND